MLGYPFAFNLPQGWATYIKAISATNFSDVMNIRSKCLFIYMLLMILNIQVTSTDYGLMGSSGISAGAFLVSPYSTDGAPDIQLTVFPTVYYVPHNFIFSL